MEDFLVKFICERTQLHLVFLISENSLKRSYYWEHLLLIFHFVKSYLHWMVIHEIDIQFMFNMFIWLVRYVIQYS